MSVYNLISNAFHQHRTLLFVLIDPDNMEKAALPAFIADAERSGVDGFLVGGSLSLLDSLDAHIQIVKKHTAKPVVIFPGGVHHISPFADAIMFLSLISGRNADQLIGQHVIAAPIIKRLNLEAISTGYMLIESGRTTTAEYMSNSKPIPRNKPQIAAAHAMAAELLGMKMLYLEAGSGAEQPVPEEMVSLTKRSVNIPLIVGGGIRTPGVAWERAHAGATVIVIGNHFEDEHHHVQMKAFADAVHASSPGLSITV